jgi:hypothetical protein
MSEPRHLALLVGVDRYRYLIHNQLHSCVNDARLMADTLAGRYGFLPQDTTLLLDEAATRAAVLDGLAQLRRRARPGDVVVFFWSGHGSRVTDLGGGESDGWRESLVPHDSGRAPDPNRDIADDEIYAWLLAVSEVTRNVVVIADSCFAAGVAREAAGSLEKWLAPDRRPRRRRTAALPALPALAARRDAGPSGFLPLDERYVLLAACRAGEGAKELKSRPLSAFTCFLCQELWRAPATATYREVVERVRLALAAEVQDQVPQVEGARDRVLFGESTGRPAPFLPLLEHQNGEVVLGGGIVHGVVPGSIWAIYPSGTRRPQAGGAPLGMVRIASSQAVRSRGVIVRAQGAIEAGARAFAYAPGPCPPRLAVVLDDGSTLRPAAAAFAAAIAESPLLVLQAGGEGGAVHILAVEPGEAAKPRAARRQSTAPAAGSAAATTAAAGSRPRLRVDEPSWVALSAEGKLLLPPRGAKRAPGGPGAPETPGGPGDPGTPGGPGDPGDSGASGGPRDREASGGPGDPDMSGGPGDRKASGGPGNPGASGGTGASSAPPAGGAVALEIDLLRRRGSGPYETARPDAGGEVVFEAGDQLALRVTHHDPQPLYLQVLDVGLLGAIEVLYPLPGAGKALAPGLAFEIGIRRGEELIVGLPDGLAAMARATGRRRCEGREALKIFLTAEATDLSLWQRGGDRAAPAVAATPDRWAERTLTFVVRGARAATPAAAASRRRAPLADPLQREADPVVAVAEAAGVGRVVVAAQRADGGPAPGGHGGHEAPVRRLLAGADQGVDGDR